MPTDTVLLTVFAAVSITDAFESLLFVTYTVDPSGEAATMKGPSPTGMVVTSVPFVVSITLTLFPAPFAT